MNHDGPRINAIQGENYVTGCIAFTELVDGAFKTISFESISTAKAIADNIGGPLVAAVMGAGVTATASQAKEYGADRILVADHEELKAGQLDACIAAAAQLVEKADPAVVVIGSTAMGKDIAARLSARLGAPLAMDCVAVRVENGQVVATRPMYGGKVLADVSLTGSPAIVAIRPRAMEAVAAEGAGEVEAVTVDLSGVRVTLIEKQMETGKIELTEADVVVTGGRGMGGNDYSVVEAWPRFWTVPWVRPAVPWTKAGGRFPIRSGKPARSWPPTCMWPAVFPVPFSTWPAWPPRVLSWPSTRTRMHRFSPNAISVSWMICSRSCRRSPPKWRS
nr:electron transfer flavoprotein subunit alpha/FixB family protein [Desulfosarcina cetonica]